MGHKIISIIFLLLGIEMHAQQFIGKNGIISFFSETPLENISAENKKVSAIYNANTKEIAFQLKITDFVFPNSLMQEHFNENYLESDLFPKSTLTGKVIKMENTKATVEGNLTIHGKTKKIIVVGELKQEKGTIHIIADFKVALKDFDIDIPTVVMYKIAEQVAVHINIKLQETE